MTATDAGLDGLVRQLMAEGAAVPASEIRGSRALPEAPGLYAWWADAPGLAQLSEALGGPLSPLVYAGQAGAASARSGRVGTATLRSRVLANHLGGNIRSSTFRLTLCAALRAPLDLRLTEGAGLERASNAALSGWMDTHLRLTWVTHSDRQTLAALEEATLRVLDPPLNLQGMRATPVRRHLRQLRAALGPRRARGRRAP